MVWRALDSDRGGEDGGGLLAFAMALLLGNEGQEGVDAGAGLISWELGKDADEGVEEGVLESFDVHSDGGGAHVLVFVLDEEGDWDLQEVGATRLKGLSW